ncbi:MAG TPA: hypothetical protein VGJ73_04250 [Verrucomicrobiae bacterium]|jgi:hypothetical protein
MSDGKKPGPGPIGLYGGSGGIDAGTLERVGSPRPGPLGLQLKEGSGRRDWWHVQKTVAAFADTLTGQMLVPSGKSVFYADGLGKVATLWAEATGRKTIDLTEAGEALADFTEPLKGRFRWVEDLRPAWARLSESFARQAAGEVHVFVRGQKAAGGAAMTPGQIRMPQPSSGGERRTMVRGAGSVFWEVEYPELKEVRSLQANSRVTRIIFHLCDNTGRELDQGLQS